MDQAVNVVKRLTLVGILGLVLYHAADVGRLLAALVETLRRAIGVANG